MDKRGLAAGIILGIVVIAVIGIASLLSLNFDSPQFARPRNPGPISPQSLCEPECTGCTSCQEVCRVSVDPVTGNCPVGEVGHQCAPKPCLNGPDNVPGNVDDLSCCGTQCFDPATNFCCTNAQGNQIPTPIGGCCGNIRWTNNQIWRGIGCGPCETCSGQQCFACSSPELCFGIGDGNPPSYCCINGCDGGPWSNDICCWPEQTCTPGGLLTDPSCD